MITLGVIEALDNKNNFCTVRLPTFEGAGNKVPVSVSATQMLPPGIGAGYEVGDVVFVSFVDNTLGRPVVLGQLYKGPGKGTKVDKIGSSSDVSLGIAKTMTCEELVAKFKATIPQTTTFEGAGANYNSPADLIQRIQDLEAEINQLKGVLFTFAGAAATATSLTNPVLSSSCAALAAAVAVSTVV